MDINLRELTWWMQWDTCPPFVLASGLPGPNAAGAMTVDSSGNVFVVCQGNTIYIVPEPATWIIGTVARLMLIGISRRKGGQQRCQLRRMSCQAPLGVAGSWNPRRRRSAEYILIN